MEKINEDLFVLILGHGRSGTTVCGGLLSQSPEVNVAYEYLNNSIGDDNYNRRKGVNPKLLPYEYNGNKVVLHHFIDPDVVLECLEKKIYVFHDRWKTLKVIFTKRDPVDIMVSRLFRAKGKGTDLSMDTIFLQFMKADRGLRKLKRHFGEYHVFDFAKAVECDLHIKWLFDYVGVEYLPYYRDTYSGTNQYQYGSMRKENIMFGREDRYLELREEIEGMMKSNKYWPHASLNRI